MMDFLQFRWMVTPALLKVLWWVVAAGSVIGGIVAIGSGSVGAGLGILVGGTLGTRVLFELLILSFAIHSNLTDIRSALLRDEASQTAAASYRAHVAASTPIPGP